MPTEMLHPEYGTGSWTPLTPDDTALLERIVDRLGSAPSLDAIRYEVMLAYIAGYDTGCGVLFASATEFAIGSADYGKRAGAR